MTSRSVLSGLSVRLSTSFYLFKAFSPVNKAIPQQASTTLLLITQKTLSEIFIKERQCFLPSVFCCKFVICWHCLIEERMLHSSVQLHFKGLLVLDHTFNNSREAGIDPIIFACINPQDRSGNLGYRIKGFWIRPTGLPHRTETWSKSGKLVLLGKNQSPLSFL
jgi:hypothetical protein